MHYYSRQYDEAIALAKKAQELDHQFSTAHRLLSLAFQGKRMFDEAIAENERWRALTGNGVDSSLALAQLYAASGRGDEARDLCRKLEPADVGNANIFRGMALVHAALNEPDPAFAWLEKGYEMRDDSLCTIKVDPKFDNLRPDPRFALLLQKIGLDR